MGSSLLQESDNISILRGYIITPGMAMILLDNILRIMSSEAFGKDKSAYIVGGEKKLISLIEAGKIVSDKPVNKQKLYGKRPIIKLESPYLASLNTIPF